MQVISFKFSVGLQPIFTQIAMAQIASLYVYFFRIITVEHYISLKLFIREKELILSAIVFVIRNILKVWSI